CALDCSILVRYSFVIVSFHRPAPTDSYTLSLHDALPILSFRMQGVEFDNGDMYVDGHKAASDVRDEFVSVTDKLMDELAQCYNVLPQLDINKIGRAVQQECRDRSRMPSSA